GTTQNYTTNRGLMKFNIAGVLPRNAKITSVTLTVSVVGEPVDGDNPSTFALHRMLRDWGEGTGSGHPPQQSGLGRLAMTNEAIWSHRFAFTTNSWAVSGGAGGIDFSPNPSGETYVYGTAFSPYTFETTTTMTSDLQTWLNQPETNFGWLMLSQTEELNFSARRFASREDTNRAPVLTVEYFVPQINQITLVSNSVELKFLAEAGQEYTVEWRNGFGPNSWLTLTNVPAPMEQTNCVVKDFLSSTQRFYRLYLP
ncbi:MAG: DNRLRE domain-containing protein, partial [Verrucomicrobiota bacterium]